MKSAISTLLLSLLTCFVPLRTLATNETPTVKPDRTHHIEVDFSATDGEIRPLHGVNNGPYAEGFRVNLSRYFEELKIPYVRIHEPNYPARGCVHLQYVFPDMTADPEDPANYDFSDSDDYIAAVIATGAKPIYNLGLGNHHHDLRGEKYRNSKIPPKDNQKIAKICVNIARHYNHGWKNGFQYNIQYWDIWNEPNGKNHWAGTLEQYFELYAAVASALKADDPALKVGGPSLAPAGKHADFDWLARFLDLCRQRNVPLDFCSWHSYDSVPSAPAQRGKEVQRLLQQYGYAQAENVLAEWSPTPLPFLSMRKDPLVAREFFERNGSIEGGAYDVAVLCYLQDSPVDIANFYGGDTNPWGMIDRFGAPKTSYFAFKAFRRMLDTPKRVSAKGSDELRGLAVLAGRSDDGAQASILIANFSADLDRYEIHFKGLPWRGAVSVKRSLVDNSHALAAVATDTIIAGEANTLTVPASKPSVILLELTSPGK